MAREEKEDEGIFKQRFCRVNGGRMVFLWYVKKDNNIVITKYQMNRTLGFLTFYKWTFIVDRKCAFSNSELKFLWMKYDSIYYRCVVIWLWDFFFWSCLILGVQEILVRLLLWGGSCTFGPIVRWVRQGLWRCWSMYELKKYWKERLWKLDILSVVSLEWDQNFGVLVRG